MQKYLELLKNQIILDIKERLCYRINLISDLALFTLIYFAVFYLAASGESTAESRFLTLLGYIFWQFNAMALGYSTSTIRLEASRGTLELYIQSRYSIILLMGIRLMISLMISAVTMSGILVFSIAVHILNFSNLVFFLKALVLIVPSIIGMYGIGLMIGAVGLGEKKYRTDGYDHSGDDAVFDQHDTDREIQYSSFITVCSRNRNRSDTLFGAAHISAHFPWICGAESPVAGGRSLFF